MTALQQYIFFHHGTPPTCSPKNRNSIISIADPGAVHSPKMPQLFRGVRSGECDAFVVYFLMEGFQQSA